MPLYNLSMAAENDIFKIALYTAEKWGAKQAKIYAKKLEKGMEQLALQEGFYKSLNRFTPPVLVKHCEHHYIFGQQEGESFFIIAVLHERMETITHITKRLNY